MGQKGKQLEKIKWPMALQVLDTVVLIDCIISVVCRCIKKILAKGWGKLKLFELKIELKIFHEDREARCKRKKKQKHESDLAAMKKWQKDLNQTEFNQ